MTSRISRRLRLLTLTCVAAAVALSLPLLAPTRASADAVGPTTVTGTQHAWDPSRNAVVAAAPTVTVSQTTDLVDQVVHVSWTNFTPSSNDTTYATLTPGVSFQPNMTVYPVQVVECAGTAPTESWVNNDNKTGDCYQFDAGSTSGPSGLGNSVRTVTQADGTGQADFHVVTAAANQQLGCDSTHPCSIAVVPNWGGVQPSDPTRVACANHRSDYTTPRNGYDLSVWSGDAHLGGPCSWADRIVVPLTFAPSATNCPATASAFSAVGSPMAARAVYQWSAGWCTGANALSFAYNPTVNEYEARQNFLTPATGLGSSTDVALTSQPGTPTVASRKFTYAPVDNTAIAIAFEIDDPSTGKPFASLNLNARLVAKLLTQSYAPYNYSCAGLSAPPSAQSGTCDPAVYGNPTTIFRDPEFLALNPGLDFHHFPSSYVAIGAYFPIVVAGNSDLIWQLTSWIASDKDAAAFLAGTPDGYADHMHVNTYYKGIQYPTSQLQTLDPGYTNPDPKLLGNGTMQNTWQPVTGLNTVGTMLVNNTSSSLNNSQSACDAAPCPYPKVTEAIGQRALFAVIDQGQAAAYRFPTANLVNAAGAAVAPTTAAVTAGLAAMTTDADGITRTPDYTSTDPAAYPLATVDYAMVPTCGLAAAKAGAVGTFLDRVLASQDSGVLPGQLAPGYLPLSSAQQVQVQAAAAAVRAQHCPATAATGPTGTGSTPPHATTPVSNPAPAGGGQGDGGQSTGSTAGAGAGSGSGTTPSAAAAHAATSLPASVPATAPSAAQPSPVAYGVKSGDGAGGAPWALPVIVVVGAVLLLGGPLLLLASATPIGAAVTGQLRRWWP